MNLYRLPSGAWRATVAYGGQIRRVTRRTQREARSAGSQLLLDLEAEIGPTTRRRTSTDDLTVGALLEMYQRRAEHSATYAADVERVVKRLPATIKARRVTTVRPVDVDDDWYPQLAAAGWTVHRIRRAHVVLSAAFTRAVKWGIIRHNPFAAATPPKIEAPEVRPPTVAELARLIAGADRDPCFSAFVRLAADSGARRGELLGVRWADVDADAATVTFQRAVAYTPAAGVIVKDTKSGRKGRRTVTVDPATVTALRAWKSAQGQALTLGAVRGDAYVFSATGDSPRRPDWAGQRWARLCDEVGVKVNLHALRHGVATARLAAGEDVVRVSRRMGHSRVSTTLDTYAHLVPGG